MTRPPRKGARALSVEAIITAALSSRLAGASAQDAAREVLSALARNGWQIIREPTWIE